MSGKVRTWKNTEMTDRERDVEEVRDNHFGRVGPNVIKQAANNSACLVPYKLVVFLRNQVQQSFPRHEKRES